MNPAIILMLPVSLALVGLARFAMWLFPEQTGNRNHYDGDFGRTDQTLQPYDSMTDEQHKSCAAFYGFCEGDQDK